jgi:hypothetical protein
LLRFRSSLVCGEPRGSVGANAGGSSDSGDSSGSGAARKSSRAGPAESSDGTHSTSDHESTGHAGSTRHGSADDTGRTNDSGLANDFAGSGCAGHSGCSVGHRPCVVSGDSRLTGGPCRTRHRRSADDPAAAAHLSGGTPRGGTAVARQRR